MIKSDLDRVMDRFKRATGLDQSHCVVLGKVGSLSHGTYIEDHIDDRDYMGAFLPEPEALIGLRRRDHWVTQWEELDVTMYSLEKLVRLLLKANPNVVGMLWLRPEDYLLTTEAFDMLRSCRGMFSSKLAYNSFVGYAYSQLKKMEHSAYKGYMGEKRKRLVKQHGYDCKNASHLIRLLRMGTEFLRTGEMNVWRDDREELLAIKMGKWSLEEVKMEANRLFEAAKTARDESPLPDEPDYLGAEEWLMQVQFHHLKGWV